MVGHIESFGDRVEQRLVSAGEPLVHVAGEASDEVHADFLRGRVHGLGDRHQVVRAGSCSDQGDRRHGDALVDDGHAIVRSHGIRGLHQLRGVVHDLGVDLFTGALEVRVGAVEQVDAQGRRANVEGLEFDHADELEDFIVSVGCHGLVP